MCVDARASTIAAQHMNGRSILAGVHITGGVAVIVLTTIAGGSDHKVLSVCSSPLFSGGARENERGKRSVWKEKYGEFLESNKLHLNQYKKLKDHRGDDDLCAILQ